MPEAQSLVEVTVEIAYYARAYVSHKVKVTPEQAAELKAAYELEHEIDAALVEHIFQNGQLTGSTYDVITLDEPEYEVIHFGKQGDQP